MEPIEIIEKRRLQAEVVKPIYDELKAELGLDAARRLIGAAIRKAAVSEGGAYASAEPGGSDFSRFKALLPLWTRGEALQVEVLQDDERHFSYNVTRCRYAEMYTEMGLREIGHLLSCGRDKSFCDGYDPRIRLSRSQTIMEGAPFCDFRYTLDPDSNDIDGD